MMTHSGGHADPLAKLAEFVAGQGKNDIPDAARSIAVNGVVDFLGVATRGAQTPALRPFVTATTGTYRLGTATALGVEMQMAPEGVAFINGAAGHILDFDDTHDTINGHPSAAILPAVLATAETMGLSGGAVVSAYIVGVEVEAALARCLDVARQYQEWHPTSVLGVFGSAAAVARLLELDEKGVEGALSVAASLASGVRGAFGSAGKAVQVGMAASKGVVAAQLARSGVSAGRSAFAGEQSFSAVFGKGRNVDWRPLDELGVRWEIADPGLTFKRYPCCASTHAAAEALIELQSAEKIDANAVRQIEVMVDPRRIPHTNRPAPQNGLEAKFSMQYVAASALLDGKIDLTTFEPGALIEPRTRALVGKVRVETLPAAERRVLPGRQDCFAASVMVELTTGQKFRNQVTAPASVRVTGAALEREVSDKFLEVVGAWAGKAAATEALGVIREIDKDERGPRECMAVCGALSARRRVPDQDGSDQTVSDAKT